MSISKVKLYGKTNGSGDLVVTREFGAAVLHAIEIIDSDLDSGRTMSLKCVNTESGFDREIYGVGAVDEGSPLFQYFYVDSMPVISNGDLELTIVGGGANKQGGCIVYYQK